MYSDLDKIFFASLFVLAIAVVGIYQYAVVTNASLAGLLGVKAEPPISAKNTTPEGTVGSMEAAQPSKEMSKPVAAEIDEEEKVSPIRPSSEYDEEMNVDSTIGNLLDLIRHPSKAVKKAAGESEAPQP